MDGLPEVPQVCGCPLEGLLGESRPLTLGDAGKHRGHTTSLTRNSAMDPTLWGHQSIQRGQCLCDLGTLGWRIPEDETGGKKHTPLALFGREIGKQLAGGVASQTTFIPFLTLKVWVNCLKPQFPHMLNEDAQSACFTGRIRELGVTP